MFLSRRILNKQIISVFLVSDGDWDVYVFLNWDRYAMNKTCSLPSFGKALITYLLGYN